MAVVGRRGGDASRTWGEGGPDLARQALTPYCLVVPMADILNADAVFNVSPTPGLTAELTGEPRRC